MAAGRKLQAEVEKVLKKVEEGIEEFNHVWDNVHSATHANQREKFEAELKTQMKRLQRDREQIKTWQGDKSIKDKNALADARKKIEVEMERFKEFERDAKTKTYSKEGLSKSDKVDPYEEQRIIHRTWIQENIDKLQVQIDEQDADIEAATTSKKKKGNDDAHTEHLKLVQETHRWHVTKLEQLLRKLDNDDVANDDLDELRDSVEYYVDESSRAIGEFQPFDTIYEAFGLEDVEDYLTKDRDRVDTKDELLEKDADAASDAPDKTPKAEPEKVVKEPEPAKAPSKHTAGPSVAKVLPPASPSPTARPAARPAREEVAEPTQNKAWPPMMSIWQNPPPPAAPAEREKAPPAIGQALPPAKPGPPAARPAPTLPPPMQPAPDRPPPPGQALDRPPPPGQAPVLNAPPNQPPPKPAPHQPPQMQPPTHAPPQPPLPSPPLGSPPRPQGPAGGLAGTLAGIVSAMPMPAPPPMPPPSPLEGPSSNPAVGQPSIAPAGIVGSTGAPGGGPNAKPALSEPPTTAPPPPPPPLLPPPPPSPAPAPGGPPSSTPSLPPGQVKKPPVAPFVPDVGGQQAPKVPPPSEAPPPPSESPPPPPPEGPNASKDAESGSVPSALGLSESRLPGVPAAGENSRSRAPAAPTASGASGGEKTAKAPPAGAQGGKRLETDWTTPSALSFEPGGLMPPPPPAPGTTRPGESSGSSGTPEAGGPLSPWRLNALNLLSASHRHLPAASDGRRNRRYVPRNPYVHVDTRGNAAYPMQPTRNYEDPAMFEKYDLDTLFFIFYYQQGSYQQHLAAKELKKLSWRYHTKYLTWFQRHEEPRMTASDFERGAYVYFDHDSGWCQRIKSDFTFEYAYLEDEPM